MRKEEGLTGQADEKSLGYIRRQERMLENLDDIIRTTKDMGFMQDLPSIKRYRDELHAHVEDVRRKLASGLPVSGDE